MTTTLARFSKQGNSWLRFLLVEAAQVTVRSDVRWRNRFFHLAQRRGRKIAKVAMARRLAVRLYWMWRRGWNYVQLESFGSHVGQVLRRLRRVVAHHAPPGELSRPVFMLASATVGAPGACARLLTGPRAK